MSVEFNNSRYSWVDSFKPSDKTCPFSPRYSDLSKGKNPLWAEESPKKLYSPLISELPENVFSPRYNSEPERSINFQKSENLEQVFSPRYSSLHFMESTETNSDPNSIFSPRYTMDKDFSLDASHAPKKFRFLTQTEGTQI